MKCTKAIIPVAGLGTRRLPITKTIEKCMLPVLNRPIIDYVVDDCVKAGITDIYIVVSAGATQVRDYYTQNPGLETHLRDTGKDALVASVQPPAGVKFHFVEQQIGPEHPYGSSVPVMLCREFLEPDEHVLVVMGDDFIFNADGSSEVARLLAAAETTGGSAMLAAQVPRETVSHYGVIVTRDDVQDMQFDYIQEKPSIAEAKSNLINISKYVFRSDFFSEYLSLEVKTNGEYYITDSINDYVASGNSLSVVPVTGTYLDGGTAEKWVHANRVVFEASQHAVSDRQ